eukprot:Phypoly_transcript_08901.p1 GENE.Phypoly_transcript_08901~~Phypoly_transcript_08901.p1  ORF type:complete len:352 (+),score=45.93 Phypoly_transcript_08901:345-1400(+)
MLDLWDPLSSRTTAPVSNPTPRRIKVDLIVHNGDLAYDLDDLNGAVGEEFMENIQEISSRVPYTVSPGNHEYNGNSQAYYQGWWQGQNTLGALSNSTNPLLWYSFDISYAHIVVVNTEVYCEDPTKIAAQWNWLNNDLANFRAKNNGKWLFFFGHRQMYLGTTGAFDSYLQRFGLNCTDPTNFATCNVHSPCRSNVPSQCGFALEPLLFKYKVDFSIEGHQHIYQRYFPIGPNQVYETQALGEYINPQFPVHLLTGAGGMQSSSPSYLPPAKRSTNHVAVQYTGTTPPSDTTIPNWTTARIYNLTHIEFTQLTTLQTAPLDNFWVIKDSTKPAWTARSTFAVNPTTATGCQ